MDAIFPSTIQAIFCSFATAFTTPSYANFVTLTTGWMLCQGRHTISGAIRAGRRRGRGRHHSALYRLLSRAVWSVDEMGQVLFRLLLPLITDAEICLLVDDTLARRSGPHLWGGGMHYDPLRSTYGRGAAARWLAMAFGHNWVVVAVWVPVPWNSDRGIAVPILWRLYRSKKRCPQGEYRKRTVMAREMLKLIAGWLPSDRKAMVIGDSEYACNTLVRHLPPSMEFTGPLLMTAALYDIPRRQPRRGRRRTKGDRFPTPGQIAGDAGVRWRKAPARIYGRDVPLKIKTFEALWPSVCGTRRIQVVITRDPRGRLDDRAYFCTRLDLNFEEVLVRFSRRWSLEVTFRAAKQDLGLDEPQNGWGRRRHGARRGRKRPGPQPRGERGRKAVERTLPLVFLTYGIVVAWYLRHGKPKQDVALAKRLSPWYRHKREPAFADMLAAARREIVHARIQADPLLHRVPSKIRRLLVAEAAFAA